MRPPGLLTALGPSHSTHGGDMSTAIPSAGLGLDSGGLWHRRALQRSCTLARTYLMSCSVPPLPLTNASCLRNTLQLPSLAVINKPRHQTHSVALSVIKPSLCTPGERAVLERFSRNCRPPLRRRPPPPSLSCKSCITGGHIQNSQPVYMHFSFPIRPAEKLMVKSRRQSLSTEQRERGPLVMQYRQAPHEGTLAVRGKHCLPSPPAHSVAPTPARTQLHVFLPTEGAGEGEEGDNESVDEGFMDELDNKVTSLKLHQGEPKTSIPPDNASYC